MDDVKIIGGNGIRHERDFYPTPPETTQALLNFLQLPRNITIWECACGEKDMQKTIESNGYNCIGTDINDGYDFLKTNIDCDWIITNPPFNVADKFILHAIELNRPFALLLKSQYWHSKKRFNLFMQHKPKYVLPLTWRPDFTGQGSSLMDVIWVVWDGKVDNTYFQPLEKPSGIIVFSDEIPNSSQITFDDLIKEE